MAEKTVEQRCYEALKARGVTFAAAESCTGGLIAKRITDRHSGDAQPGVRVHG